MAASSSSGGHHPVDQPPLQSGVGVDGVAGEGQLHGLLAADGPADCDQRRVAEPAAFAARRGKPGPLGRHGQIGAGHQLTAGRRRQPVHPGDHRLAQALDGRHQLGARPQQFPHGHQIGPDHVGEVVTGGEHRPVAGQDHPAGIAVARPGERPPSAPACARATGRCAAPGGSWLRWRRAPPARPAPSEIPWRHPTGAPLSPRAGAAHLAPASSGACRAGAEYVEAVALGPEAGAAGQAGDGIRQSLFDPAGGVEVLHSSAAQADQVMMVARR